MVTFSATSLLDQERLFTLKQLASWRQLEAYNYFENNYVQTIIIHILIVNKQCQDDGKIRAQQYQKKKMADVIARMEGSILSAYCTCKAV